MRLPCHAPAVLLLLASLAPLGVARAQPSGTVLFTSTNYVQTNATLTESDGARFYAGAFSDTLRFNGSTVAIASADADGFVARVSSAGLLEWLRVLGGATTLPAGFSADAATSLASDGAGGVYVGGGFTDSLRVPTSAVASQWLAEPTASGIASLGAFVVRYSSAGDALFVRGGGGGARPAGTALRNGGADGVLALAADGSGGVVVGGSVSGAGSFLGAPYTPVLDSIPSFAVARLTNTGTVSWLRVGESTRQNSTRSVAVGGARAFAVGPYFGGLTVGDGKSLPDEGGSDTFMASLDLNTGAIVWASNIGGDGDVTVNGVASDADGALYMTGPYFGAFEETSDSPGYVDGYLVKFDRDGNDEWVQFFGALASGDTYAEGITVEVNADGLVLLSGRFTDTISFYLDQRKPLLTGDPDNISTFAAAFSTGGTYLWSRTVTDSDGLLGEDFQEQATGGLITTPLYPVQGTFAPGSQVRQVSTFAELNTTGFISVQGVAETLDTLPPTAVYSTMAQGTTYFLRDGTAGSRVVFDSLGTDGDPATVRSLAFVTEPGTPPDSAPDGATPVARSFYLSAETLNLGEGSNFKATVTLCYLDEELNGLDEATLSLYRYGLMGWDESGFVYGWMRVPSTPNPASNCVTASGVEAFSPWAIAPSGAGGLPVELTAFTATRDGDQVHLAWSTASESHNAGFGVEVTTSAAAEAAPLWREVAFVPGAGTSAERHSYAHTLLPATAAGATRVRLRQMDIDGTAHYTAAVEIAAPNEMTLGQPFPNPARSGSTVRFTLPRTMTLRLVAYDALGRAVKTVAAGEFAAGTHTVVFGDDLAAGTYMLRLEGLGVTRLQSLTIVR